MTRPNAFDADFSDKYDDAEPDGYRIAEAPFGKAAGGTELAVRLFELPPGQTICPYHYEYVEEWLLVMTGEVQLRTPQGTSSARAGDIVCFPTGADGAHQVWNEAAAPARVVMFSADAAPAVTVYPDSDKVGVWTSNDRDNWMFRGAEGKLEYFDGEPPAPGRD
jgi:uncharacterized cupin superfamily protein